MSAVHRSCLEATISFRPKSAKNAKFSILLVGPAELCNLVCDGIYETNEKKHKLDLLLIKAETIDSISKSSYASAHVDFVVIIVDPRTRNCIELVDTSMLSIHREYLSDRVVLLVGKNKLALEAVSSDELQDIQRKYSLRAFHGVFSDKNSVSLLSDRILNIAKVVCGITSGIPTTLLSSLF